MNRDNHQLHIHNGCHVYIERYISSTNIIRINYLYLVLHNLDQKSNLAHPIILFHLRLDVVINIIYKVPCKLTSDCLLRFYLEPFVFKSRATPTDLNDMVLVSCTDLQSSNRPGQRKCNVHVKASSLLGIDFFFTTLPLCFFNKVPPPLFIYRPWNTLSFR